MSQHALQNQTDAQTTPIIIHANYEMVTLGVVLLSLLNFPLLVLLPSPAQRDVIVILELGITAYLLADAFYRLARAPSRSRFLWRYHGWLMFLGSLPYPLLRLARLLYVLVAYRRLKRSDYAAMGRVIVERRAQSTLFFVVLAAIVVMEIGSLLVLWAESDAPQANIKTASDALWWIVVTMGTVGYGDRYPVTNAGRLVGTVVIVMGVGLFSAFTSFMAQWFLAPRGQEPPDGPRAEKERKV
ncbi:MAG: potassium channel family protein [Chloroflexi bacterium]|nr:potassium channel family protein [Chloroflexota bacterium]